MRIIARFNHNMPPSARTDLMIIILLIIPQVIAAICRLNPLSAPAEENLQHWLQSAAPLITMNQFSDRLNLA
jgi:hypothetical protein